MTADSVSTTRSSSPHIAPRRSHTPLPPAPLSSQVGGHAGIQTTEDGSLLLKTALPRELEFYQLIRDGMSSDIDVATATASGLTLLLSWIPKFLGMLSLGTHLVENLPEMTAVHDLPAFVQASRTTTTIVLESLTYGFCKPRILDVKLGTILYEENAPPEKKERVIHTAASTTSLSTGVYANDHPLPKLTTKNYDQTVKPEHLPDGIVRAFPFCIPVSLSCMNVPPPTCTYPSCLLKRLHEALELLRVALATAEVLIVGGSILIIYEADWASAEKAAQTSEDVSILNDEATAKGEGEDKETITVEIGENGHLIVDDVVAGGDEESEDEDEHHLFRLSLIDFAHMQLVPGQGPDTGVLLGIDTLIRLIHEGWSVVRACIDEGADVKNPC
ncbi:hypothetical protein PISMIDRAFT_15358 [Pisolithus microcarpus 441]|uniref:Kinase n=1 Tax=Pisolithus microcarpus 441 TaxID=765257 RepID=A0A0C9ZB13_9AGAM|nr:hypothetical protein PISMIDRAFT_15358 [Pisolithus microcarpus 441]